MGSPRRRTRADGHHFKLVEAEIKTAAEPHVKRELDHLEAAAGASGGLAASLRMPLRSGPTTRSAVGTAGVDDVHQRQRTGDDASGLSKDLSSLDEDDSLVQQPTHVAVAEQEGSEEVTDLDLSSKTLSVGGQ